ncbi:hypothetical protein D9758_008804 [Tetrapyrgos nigripes]|uniref:F-box domain-containing protein n=1 Tax=Tetrapyrgos nigripes TaxID=182062 RepID=A0A8H5FY76_9AGAR|nr:hypothetical protein D9758_008804 [Tetrapyrgos nigripes]
MESPSQAFYEFPTEIIHLILGHLQTSSGGKHYLKLCSLVSHSWTFPAQSCLFSDVQLVFDNEERVYHFLELCSRSDTNLPLCVKSLRLWRGNNRAQDDSSTLLLDRFLQCRVTKGKLLLDLFQNLVTLELGRIEHWRLSDKAKKVLLSRFQTVLKLQLCNVVFGSVNDFQDFTYSFPRLESIKLVDVSLRKEDVSARRPAHQRHSSSSGSRFENVLPLLRNPLQIFKMSGSPRSSFSFDFNDPSLDIEPVLRPPSELQSISLTVDLDGLPLFINALTPCSTLRSLTFRVTYGVSFECAEALGKLVESSLSLQQMNIDVHSFSMNDLDPRFKHLGRVQRSSLRKLYLNFHNTPYIIPFLARLIVPPNGFDSPLETVVIKEETQTDLEEIDDFLQGPCFSSIQEIRCTASVRVYPRHCRGDAEFTRPDEDTAPIFMMAEKIETLRERMPNCNAREILTIKEHYYQ